MLGDGSLQKAVYARMREDDQLGLIMAQTNPEVYDYVPENAKFPYIHYQNVSSTEWDTTTEEGFEVIFALHVWSQEEGTKETHKIMQRIYRLFHNQIDLAVELYKLVNLQFQVSDVNRDPDGQTYHGVIRFRAVLDSLETEAP